jgi:hypothetical protein
MYLADAPQRPELIACGHKTGGAIKATEMKLEMILARGEAISHPRHSILDITRSFHRSRDIVFDGRDI